MIFLPSSPPPSFKEILVKLSCFFALDILERLCVYVSVYVCVCVVVLYSNLHCLFNFITQFLNPCSKVMTHDWSETLGIAEGKEVWTTSDKSNLELESDYCTSGQLLIPKPYPKDSKIIVLAFKTEIVNLQIFGKI